MVTVGEVIRRRLIKNDYIVVYRGITEDIEGFLRMSREHFPTLGCIVFPELGQRVSLREGLSASKIHRVFSCGSDWEDSRVIDFVKGNFPEYSDDLDPIIEPKIPF